MLRRSRSLYVGGYCLSEEPSPANVAAFFARPSNAASKPFSTSSCPSPAITGRFCAPSCRGPMCPCPTMTRVRRLRAEGAALQALCFLTQGEVVIVTCGSEGAVAASPEGNFAQAVSTCAQVDGTGSGDAFAAGYIHGAFWRGPALLNASKLGQDGSKLCPSRRRDHGRV